MYSESTRSIRFRISLICQIPPYHTDYMNNLSTQLASDSSSNQTALKTGTTVLNSIQDSRDSLSGVSLDEEATNMMAYVSAYNAASRLMTALDEVLNTLISNTGA